MKFTHRSFAVALLLSLTSQTSVLSRSAHADSGGAMPSLSARYCEQIRAKEVVEQLRNWSDQRSELAQAQKQSTKDFERLVGRAEVVAYTSSAFAAVGAVGLALIPGVAAYVLPLGSMTGTGLVVSSASVPVVYHSTRYLIRTAPDREADVRHLEASLKERLGEAHDNDQVPAVLAEAAQLPKSLAHRFGEVRRNAGNEFDRYLKSVTDPTTGQVRSRWYTFGHDDRRYVAALAADAKTQWEITMLEVKTTEALATQLEQECTQK